MVRESVRVRERREKEQRLQQQREKKKGETRTKPKPKPKTRPKTKTKIETHTEIHAGKKNHESVSIDTEQVDGNEVEVEEEDDTDQRESRSSGKTLLKGKKAQIRSKTDKRGNPQVGTDPSHTTDIVSKKRKRKFTDDDENENENEDENANENTNENEDEDKDKDHDVGNNSATNDDNRWIKNNTKLAEIENELRSKKLPTYKVEQLQRLQRLIKLSAIARPRTNSSSSSKDKSEQNLHNEGLKLILDNAKEKISNVPNYNPDRVKLLNKELTTEEKDQLSQRYSKIERYKDIKCRRLSEDKLLRAALDEISSDKSNLKFWEYYNSDFDNFTYGDSSLFENEKRLQSFNIDNEQLINLRFQKNNGLKSSSEFAKCHSDNKYERIDLKNAYKESSISELLKQETDNDKIGEKNAFDGLKLEDFTTIRNFGLDKI